MRYALFFVLLLLVACTAPLPPPSELPAKENTPAEEMISLAELAAHDTADDCWIAYQDNVYDITGYLPQHPNMRPADYCGSSTAFEQAFEGQHGTKKVPVLEREGIYKGMLA